MSGQAGLRDVAALLAPPPGEGTAAVVTAPAGWAPPAALPDADVVVWGAPALPPGTGARAAATAAAARERTLLALRRRPPAGRSVRAVHRLDPPALRTGSRAAARAALLRGALVELVGPRAPRRVLDAVLAGADAAGPLGTLRLGAGGTVLTTVEHRGGPGVLRAAPAGAAGDPAPVAAALQVLAHDRLVPPLLGAGATAGASWTVEGRMPGTRPAGLPADLVEQVVVFCAALPQPGGSADADADVGLLARQLPAQAGRLRALAADLAPRLAQLPAVGRHGDLWSGNLLVAGGSLSAVLDWDAWSPAGVPGTDLLHLLATQERLARRAALGQVLLARPWRWPAWRSALAGYWRRLDLPAPPAPTAAAVGLAWWAAQLAGDLRRTPGLALDERWHELNVQRVLDAHADGRLDS